MNKLNSVKLIKEFTDRTNGRQTTLSLFAEYTPATGEARIYRVTATVGHYENRGGSIIVTNGPVTVDLTDLFDSNLPTCMDAAEKSGDVNWREVYTETLAEAIEYEEVYE